MNFAALAVFALLIAPSSGVFCVQATATDTTKIEWAAYEGVSLRFEYPKGWKTALEENSPGAGWKSLSVERSEKHFHAPGDISILEDAAGREKRPLDKVITEYTEGMGTLRSDVRRIKLPGGECLTFLWQVPGAYIFERGLVVSAECYNKKSRHFTIRCNVTGEYKLDKEGRRHQFIFQHLLDTLQFK